MTRKWQKLLLYFSAAGLIVAIFLWGLALAEGRSTGKKERCSSPSEQVNLFPAKKLTFRSSPRSTQDDAPKGKKQITINLKTQTLTRWQGNQKIDSWLISSGKNNWTPQGNFKIINKKAMVHSKKYDCWLPFWMAITSDGRYGFHELPICNSNNPHRQGTDQIGQPASHGCIRLDIGQAEKLYHWVKIGTSVLIEE